MTGKKYSDIEIDQHLKELLTKSQDITAHLQTLNIYQQKLENYLAQSAEEITKSTRELKKEEQLLSLALNIDEKQQQDLQKSTIHLSHLEEISKEKLLLAIKAKQDAEAASGNYNEQLNAVNQLHLQIASHKNEMADLQDKFKYVSQLWQEQNAYLAEQTKILENTKAQLNYGTELSKLILDVARATKEQNLKPVAQTIVAGLYEGREPLDLPMTDLPMAALGDKQYTDIQKFITSLNMDMPLEVQAPPVMKNTWVKSQKVEPQKLEPRNVEMAEAIKDGSIDSTFYNMTDEADISNGQNGVVENEVSQNELSQNQLANSETAAAGVENTGVAENAVAKNVGGNEEVIERKALSFIDGKEKDVWADPHTKSKKRIVFDYVICIVLAVVLALICRTYILIPTNVDGDSMYPTLADAEKIITSPIPYYFGDVSRGDIVVFQAPDQEDGVYYIKRVIALGGDQLKISGGNVYLNDVLLEEEYLDGMLTSGDVYTIIPDGTVYVMGDNRESSHDSRSESVSFISVDAIDAKAILAVYPFDSFGFIEQRFLNIGLELVKFMSSGYEFEFSKKCGVARIQRHVGQEILIC